MCFISFPLKLVVRPSFHLFVFFFLIMQWSFAEKLDAQEISRKGQPHKQPSADIIRGTSNSLPTTQTTKPLSFLNNPDTLRGMKGPLMRESPNFFSDHPDNDIRVNGPVTSLYQWKRGNYGQFVYAKGCDFSSCDFAGVDADSNELCRENCLENAKCTHFTWSSYSEKCWMKRAPNVTDPLSITIMPVHYAYCGYVTI